MKYWHEQDFQNLGVEVPEGHRQLILNMVTKIRTTKLKSGENRSFIPLNHVISEILGKRNAWFESCGRICLSKTYQQFRKLSNLGAKVWFMAKTSNVWLPSMSCLHPIRTCFSIMCPRLGENDGTSLSVIHQA